jgi:epoxyqueuosine reductase
LDDVKTELEREARAQGFDAIGITRPDAIPRAPERLKRFIAEGLHGDMEWLATTAERRGNPEIFWPQARSVIMLGLNYGPDEDPLAVLAQRARGGISVYARGED